ncbi:hypothetical protein ABVK25_009815 [Lepraria finkii]|uniref:NAD(P)-binding domain-containing protein n=1 Tax=Lepraria finkii TaxID=1340010 RepID=A0ABR4AWA1_9LECA
MPTTRPQTIALAGVGDLGKYTCEELLASPRFSVIVLSRGKQKEKWFTERQIRVYTTDYTVPSLLSILETTSTTTLISFINDPTPGYVTTHTALLTACQQSHSCKRLIPSEWIGDSETYPLKPDYYATSREPFRNTLRAQKEIEWTLFNVGWLMDYFLPARKTWMKPVPGKFPVDLEGWSALVRGSGEEVQSWTYGRDGGGGVVALCGADEWVG